MFKVYEETETYEKGFENHKTAVVECVTYDEAVQEFNNRAAAHIEAGHTQDFNTEKIASYIDFGGGNLAVASYTIMIH